MTHPHQVDEKKLAPSSRRILIIDDTDSIHRDYEKILGRTELSESERALLDLDSIMFDDEPNLKDQVTNALYFEIDHAHQGKQGYEMIVAARESGHPYHVAFVDMRMPPGWDGIQTIEKVWDQDPDLQIVICSAYTDYTWSQIIDKLGHSNRLLILKKPFDQAEVYQLATALSEKWLAERSTRDLLANLERKVEDRTAEARSANAKLTSLNKELEVAAEEAQCAARAKGRFLATMSHEIRTSLNGIMGAAHMLNAADLADSEREFAEIIQSSGEALMIVINDILDYSKYESGQLELESIPFSLRQVIEECGALLETVVRKFGVTLELKWDDAIPCQLLGDPARVRQVLLNLLNNAFKFGKNATVTLAASLQQCDAGKAHVRIDVIDRGIGMKTETLERLFSAFMQADTSTTREFGGTGLGLAICKLLADAMRARIDVSSTWGQGSTFSFNVPFALPAQTVSEPGSPGTQHPATRHNPSEEIDLTGRSVLLVDDNVVNGKLGKHFLKTFNVHVDLALNGIECLDRFESARYDVILMDLQMPEMDGLEATRLIRQRENRAGKGEHVPIIALTANAFNEVRDSCLAAGMDDFLTKPLRMNDLAVVLKRWVAPANLENPAR